MKSEIPEICTLLNAPAICVALGIDPNALHRITIDFADGGCWQWTSPRYLQSERKEHGSTASAGGKGE